MGFNGCIRLCYFAVSIPVSCGHCMISQTTRLRTSNERQST